MLVLETREHDLSRASTRVDCMKGEANHRTLVGKVQDSYPVAFQSPGFESAELRQLTLIVLQMLVISTSIMPRASTIHSL
jgi:hypothetical protein